MDISDFDSFKVNNVFSNIYALNVIKHLRYDVSIHFIVHINLIHIPKDREKNT